MRDLTASHNYLAALHFLDINFFSLVVTPRTVQKFKMRGSYNAEGWRVAILLSSVSFGALFLRYGASAPRIMRDARLCLPSWPHATSPKVCEGFSALYFHPSPWSS